MIYAHPAYVVTFAWLYSYGHGCHTCNICTKYNCHVSLVTKCVTGDFLQLTFNDVGREGGEGSGEWVGSKSGF
jgi:hypothetical protein